MGVGQPATQPPRCCCGSSTQHSSAFWHPRSGGSGQFHIVGSLLIIPVTEMSPYLVGRLKHPCKTCATQTYWSLPSHGQNGSHALPWSKWELWPKWESCPPTVKMGHALLWPEWESCPPVVKTGVMPSHGGSHALPWPKQKLCRPMVEMGVLFWHLGVAAFFFFFIRCFSFIH